MRLYLIGKDEGKFEASELELLRLHCKNFQSQDLISGRRRAIISASMNTDIISLFARGY
jgi:hypothetical protein